MKILILSNNDVGLYNFRKELIIQLISEKNDIYISLPQGEKVSLLVDIGCVFVDTNIDRRGTNPIDDARLFLEYIKILNRIKPDVILTYTVKPNVYGGLACSLMHIPYISNVTGLGTAITDGGIIGKISLILYKLGLRNAKLVFFQNAENRQYFINKNIVCNSSMLLPGSGVNLEQNNLETYPREDGTVRVLFVGRIMKNKGIEEFLSCAVFIKNKYPNVIFDIIGDFEEDRYRKKIEELVKNGLVNYNGIQNDVHSFMKNHHVVVLPSYHEGLSNVLLEAAACGRPVITTDVPGCRDVVSNGESGFICKSRNAKSLIQALEKFIYLPYEDKIKMGIKGRGKVEKEFDRNIVINAYMDTLKRI